MDKTKPCKLLTPPNDEIAHIYNAKVPASLQVHQEGIQQGIRYVAAAFNLKIKGVNC